MYVGKIFKRAAALVVDFSVADSAGAGVAGLTVKFSIFDEDTSRYWDNASSQFDSVAEVLNTGSEIGDGLYEYVLAGGLALGGTEFTVHTEATDVGAGDTYDTAEIYILDGNVTGTVDANLVEIAGSSTIDGVNIDTYFEKSQAVLYGKVVRTGNQYQFRDQADGVDLVDYTVTAAGRTVV